MNTNSELYRIQNTCRLCVSNVQLVSVFDKFDVPTPLTDIVAEITTIKICREDKVSQKMCNKCVSIVIKTFQFREQAIKNDRNLKEKYAEIMKIQQSNTIHIDLTKSELETKNENPKIKSEKHTNRKATYVVHPSITPIFKKYPNIRLPTTCISSNINPHVLLKTDEVENCLKKRKLDMQECVTTVANKQRLLAMKSTSSNSTGTAKKKTLPECVTSTKQLSVIDLTEGTKSLQDKPSIENKSTRHNHSTRSSDSPLFILDSDDSSKGKRKRKLSSSSSSSQQSVKKPLLLEAGELSSSSNASVARSTFGGDANSDLSFARCQELHVCNICNSVHSKSSGLKKHRLKHLRCQFCKLKFKSIELKDKHIEHSCKIQKVMKSMTNLPDIPLQKVEQNSKLWKTFRKAFEVFDLVPADILEPKKAQNLHEGVETTTASKVIEIISDEDETEVNDDLAADKHLFTEIEITDSKLNNILAPDNASEAKLIKVMLSQHDILHRKVSNSTQTLMPSKLVVKSNHSDSSIELKTLKHFLCYYKIPVEIKYGYFYNIVYSDSPPRENKKFQGWHDLTCCDVNFTNEPEYISREMKEELIQTEYINQSQDEEVLVEDIHIQSTSLFSRISNLDSNDSNSKEKSVHVESENDEAYRQTTSSINLVEDVDKQDNPSIPLITNSDSNASTSVEVTNNKEVLQNNREENDSDDSIIIDDTSKSTEELASTKYKNRHNAQTDKIPNRSKKVGQDGCKLLEEISNTNVLNKNNEQPNDYVEDETPIQTKAVENVKKQKRCHKDTENNETVDEESILIEDEDEFVTETSNCPERQVTQGTKVVILSRSHNNEKPSQSNTDVAQDCFEIPNSNASINTPRPTDSIATSEEHERRNSEISEKSTEENDLNESIVIEDDSDTSNRLEDELNNDNENNNLNDISKGDFQNESSTETSKTNEAIDATDSIATSEEHERRNSEISEKSTEENDLHESIVIEDDSDSSNRLEDELNNDNENNNLNDISKDDLQNESSIETSKTNEAIDATNERLNHTLNRKIANSVKTIETSQQQNIGNKESDDNRSEQNDVLESILIEDDVELEEETSNCLKEPDILNNHQGDASNQNNTEVHRDICEAVEETSKENQANSFDNAPLNKSLDPETTHPTKSTTYDKQDRINKEIFEKLSEETIVIEDDNELIEATSNCLANEAEKSTENLSNVRKDEMANQSNVEGAQKRCETAEKVTNENEILNAENEALLMVDETPKPTKNVDISYAQKGGKKDDDVFMVGSNCPDEETLPHTETIHTRKDEISNQSSMETASCKAVGKENVVIGTESEPPGDNETPKPTESIEISDDEEGNTDDNELTKETDCPGEETDRGREIIDQIHKDETSNQTRIDTDDCEAVAKENEVISTEREALRDNKTPEPTKITEKSDKQEIMNKELAEKLSETCDLLNSSACEDEIELIEETSCPEVEASKDTDIINHMSKDKMSEESNMEKYICETVERTSKKEKEVINIENEPLPLPETLQLPTKHTELAGNFLEEHINAKICPTETDKGDNTHKGEILNQNSMDDAQCEHAKVRSNKSESINNENKTQNLVSNEDSNPSKSAEQERGNQNNDKNSDSNSNRIKKAEISRKRCDRYTGNMSLVMKLHIER